MLTRLPKQRKSVRRFTRRTATVTFGSEVPPVACVIWDISDGGARLAIARTTTDLPHHFTLNLYKDGSLKWGCEVVWTDSRFVGVKFNGLVS
jgi:PilZ domain